MAQSVSVKLDVDKLKISASNINYPQDILNIELKSGLPNTIDLLIILSQDGTPVVQKIKRFSVTYDLWDEFYLIQELGKDKRNDIHVDNDKALKNALSSFDIIMPYSPELFNSKVPIVVTAQIFFNPVHSQKIKKIQNWIRTSKGFNRVEDDSDSPPQPNQRAFTKSSLGRTNQRAIISETEIGSLNQPNAASISSGPRFEKLFDKILEQHLSESSIAAQWRSTPKIATFSIKDIQNESH
jgi:hypothetical protein